MHDLQPMLAFAIEIANTAHAHQTDKHDEPYILHVTRVMNSHRMRNIRDRIVGVLHDVVEDTTTTIDDLKPHFYLYDIEALDCLTRRKGQESYDEYITRVLHNHRATIVKLADLDDNIARLGNLSHEDRSRLGPRYVRARDRIEIELQKKEEKLLCSPT